METGKLFTIDDCHLIQLPKIHNRAGNITPIQGLIEIDFEIKRVYYLYDIPGGESRGAHAHYGLYQLLVAASGSFEVELDDGRNTKIIPLNRPYNGLLIKPGIWRNIVNFSSGSICLVLASEEYDVKDYIRDYNDFLLYKDKK
jgi:hypothetical protein